MATTERNVMASTFRQATLNVVLNGLTPLLQHSPAAMRAATKEITRGKKANPGPDEEAEIGSYRNALGELVMPARAVNRCIFEAGKQFPDPQRARSNMSRRLAGAIYPSMSEWAALLRDGDPITEYEVDVQRVVITGAVMRARARIDLPWQLEASIVFDPDAIEPEQILLIASTGGRFIGIGDFRPEKSGPFGRFEVETWAVVA